MAQWMTLKLVEALRSRWRRSAGDEAELAFTVKYAAPETIQAFKRKEKTELVSSAVDVWALGVRLLTTHLFWKLSE